MGNPVKQHIFGQPAGRVRSLLRAGPLLLEALVAHGDIFLHCIADGFARSLRLSFDLLPSLGDEFTAPFASFVVGECAGRNMVVGRADCRAVVVSVADVPAHQPLTACGELAVAEVHASIEDAPIHPSLQLQSCVTGRELDFFEDARHRNTMQSECRTPHETDR